jgi:integrase
MALSDTRIKALKPKKARYEVADDGGLFIEVQPSGAKIWRYRYRLNGRREKVTFGAYPDVPLGGEHGSRERHRKARELVAASKSPAREKQAEKARGGEDESTFAGFAPRFNAEVIAQQKRPDTNRRRLNRHLLPTLGNRRLAEIEASDLLAIVDTLKTKGRIQEARHVLILARSFFAHAIARQRISRNPARDIPMKLIGPAGSRDRTLTPDEIIKLQAALKRATFLNQAYLAAIPLLLLMGCRKGELVGARWEHVDLHKMEWSMPAPKNKIAHVVPLSSQAVDLFRELRKLAGRSPYVLPSLEGRRDKPMAESSLNWALWQITRKRDGKAPLLTIPHFTLHDFRRTASTLLHEMGYPPHVIEKSLGHTVKGVAGVYNKAAYIDERQTMLQQWADYLDGLSGGKVVPLRRGNAARVGLSVGR